MEPITFSIVGCGGFTKSALDGMLAAEPWKLVALVDTDSQNLEAVRAMAGLASTSCYPSDQACYKSCRPDVVFVHTPLHVHHENVLRALEAGCHVCCQKPFVPEIRQGVDLVKRARQVERWISVGQTLRLCGTTELIGQQIAQGAIGTPAFGHRMLYRNRMRNLTGYRLEERWAVLGACAIHLFDLFRAWFGGRIGKVRFRGMDCEWNPYRESGAITGWVEMESGIVMTYLESFVSHVTLDLSRHPYEDGMIQGSRGALHWSGPWSHGPIELLSSDRTEAIQLHPGGDDWPRPMQQLMERLGRAVRGEVEPFCPADDNLWSLAAVEAAQRSAERGGSDVDVIDLGRRAGLED